MTLKKTLRGWENRVVMEPGAAERVQQIYQELLDLAKEENHDVFEEQASTDQAKEP